MERHIVVLGGGSSGTLAANRLRTYCDSPDVTVLVVDKNDTHGPETELLTALGVYGPHALRLPGHQTLRDGIAFRHADIGTVDPNRAEVCLADGTTLPYDVLVIATGPPDAAGYVVRSPGLGDQRGTVPVDRLSRRSRAHPLVYAVGAAADGHPVTGPVIHAQAERLARAVRRHLAGNPAAPRRGNGATTVAPA
jgi:NADH dehydrogenase FAD-containing subunit